jgi:hypothetical protein
MPYLSAISDSFITYLPPALLIYIRRDAAQDAYYRFIFFRQYGAWVQQQDIVAYSSYDGYIPAIP